MPTYRYLVDLDWDGPGAPGQNVWHFRQDSLEGTTSIQDVVNALSTYYNALMTGDLFPTGYQASGQSEVVDVATKQITGTTGWTLTQPTSGTTFAGPLMMVMTMRTASATKSGRGRKFLGPVQGGWQSTDGTPTSGAVAVVQGAANTLLSTSEGFSGAAIGVYSETQSLFRDMVGVRVRDYFATLRSRRD